MSGQGSATSAAVQARRSAAPSLHLPDEPVTRRLAWRRAVVDGTPLATVVAGPAGITQWLFVRWQALAPAGIDEDTLASICLGYQRELWLWLAGERTWRQCCSGLIGRLSRRTSALSERA